MNWSPSEPHGLFVETVDSSSALGALEGELRALEPRLPRLPFMSFDWLSPWWEHMAENRLLIKDNLWVLAFRDSRGALVGLAPMMLTHRPGFGLPSMRQLQFFGADPNLTEIRSVLTPVAERERVYRALVGHLRARSDSWDWLALTGVPAEPALIAIVEAAFPRVDWPRVVPDYTLELPKTFEEFKSSRSRNIKESLRKCYNSLKRDGLTFEVRVITSREEVAPALTEFFRLHRSRSQLTDTVSHQDAFASARSQRFLNAVCERFADAGRLRLFQLRIAGNVVATRIGFVCQDELYLYYSGYDPAFAKYSVMTTLLAEAVRYAIGQGVTSVNLSTGRDVSKLRWSPQESEYRNALVVSPSLRGGIAHGASKFAQSVLAAARERTTLFDSLTRHASGRAARELESTADPEGARTKLAAE